MSAPDVSVVIPVYNMASCLAECLGGLRDQTFPSERFEIILVDDGSTDNTLATANQLKIDFAMDNMVIVQQANTGPAGARNQGICLARGEIIVFLDSDCIPQPEWLEQLITPLLSADATIVGVEGRTLPAPGGHNILDHYIDNPNGGYCWTCNIAYRKSVLYEIDGFDEGFPLPASEDIDIAHRAKQLGTIPFVPEALVYHLILPRGFKKHLAMARTFSSIIRLHRKHPGLLTPNSSFLGIVLFQLKMLLFPIVTQRRQFPKAPWIYAKFCLLQLCMAIDTLLRLPKYRNEAKEPLLITGLANRLSEKHTHLRV
jgi:glycosyltransferase involved in cell wall biosynthesis